MNYLNYLKHSLFTPDTLHRRFESDLDSEAFGAVSEGSTADIMRRVTLAALPFVALYRPVGLMLSTGMSSCRAISHLSIAATQQQRGDWHRASWQLALTSLAVLSVVSTIFHFGVGVFVTTCMDLSQGMLQMAQQIGDGKYGQGVEELLQSLASGLYLGFMVTGALEVILLSTLVQGVICLYQARTEVKKGHYIEAGAKLLLSAVRGGQVLHYKEMIDRRNLFSTLKRYEDLFVKARKGRETRHLIEHELVDLQGELDVSRVTLSNAEHEYDFGSHFHGYGKGIVKGGNLAFRTVVVDGKEMTELEFKVNHVAREQLGKVIEDLSYLRGKEVGEVLSLAGSHATHLSVDKKGSLVGFFIEGSKDPVHQIVLEGLGSISVGASSLILGNFDWRVPNLYDKVIVRLDSDKTIYDLHELMAFLDLESVLSAFSQEDVARLKLGHLFHTFFPREALDLERSQEFFHLSASELQQAMTERAPDMQKVYDTYFDQMTLTEILPGRMRYRIEGLADEVQAFGVHSLTTAVTGCQEDPVLFSRVASMLSMGMISTELRDNYHVNAQGLSKVNDYSAGGADNIYLQLLPNTFVNGERALGEFSWYESRVRLQVSLKALETGTYQYTHCGLGNRDVENSDEYRLGARYPERLNILEFADTLCSAAPLEEKWSWFRAHEIMVKERLSPSYIEGMWIEDEETKQGLLEYLRSCGLVYKQQNGVETIRDVPVDQFIRVQSMLE